MPLHKNLDRTHNAENNYTVMLVILPLILVFLKYNEKYAAISGIMKSTPQAQLDRMLSGNWDSAPSYPASKVYCGDYAFYCERESLLLPLENLAWVYLTETKTKAMGIVTVSVTRSVNFCYGDEKRYTATFNENELRDLLDKKVIQLNPRVMIGYTEENRRSYAQLTGKTL